MKLIKELDNIKTAKTTKRETKSTPRTPKKSSKTGLIAGCAVALTLVLGVSLSAMYVNGLDTIYPNVSFYGAELGGMTAEEASEALTEVGFGNSDSKITVNLPLEQKLEISFADAYIEQTNMEVATTLYNYGRDGNVFTGLITYLRCLVNGYEADATEILQVDEAHVSQMVTEKVQAVNAELMGAGLTIGETSIVAYKGASSMKVDETEIQTLVSEAIADGNFTELSYTAENTGESEDINLTDIYNTVHKEPQNAEYDPATMSATAHVTGVTFDLSAAEAMWNSAAAGEKIEIQLTVTEPEITQEYLNSRLFADVLSEKSTSLAGSSWGRIENVRLSSEAINGLVLNPGEEFSFNVVVGQRTADKGYQIAGAYSGGQVISEYGGGICQVSSTIYYCTLLANLENTARLSHMFTVGYLPLGLDATVSWGGPEYKFVNTRDYPIKLIAYVEDNQCHVQILGTDVDGSYVEMTTETWVNSDGGYGAQSYRNVYDASGNLISSEPESASRYYLQGTDEDNPEETEEPEEGEEGEEGENPEESENPESSEQPSESTEPTETETPSESTEPSEPTEPTEPTETEVPVTTETPTEPEVPTEPETPVEPTAPPIEEPVPEPVEPAPQEEPALDTSTDAT